MKYLNKTEEYQIRVLCFVSAKEHYDVFREYIPRSLYVIMQGSLKKEGPSTRLELIARATCVGSADDYWTIDNKTTDREPGFFVMSGISNVP